MRQTIFVNMVIELMLNAKVKQMDRSNMAKIINKTKRFRVCNTGINVLVCTNDAIRTYFSAVINTLCMIRNKQLGNGKQNFKRSTQLIVELPLINRSKIPKVQTRVHLR